MTGKWRVIALFVSALAMSAFGAWADDDDPEIVPQELLAELVPGADPAAVAARYAITLLESAPSLRLHRYRAPLGTDPDQVVSDMGSDPEIADAELHYVIDNPEGGQRTIGDLDRSARMQDLPQQSAFTAIGGPSAVSRHSGRGVTIAVLDSGFSYRHPYLRGVLHNSFANFADGKPGRIGPQPNGRDDDGDGFVDEALGHGTFVAGLVHLMAPNARVLAIRVLDEDGRGTSFAVANGIAKALEMGARVINLSLGMTSQATAIDGAIERALELDAVVVAAAGNRNRDPVDYPAVSEPIVSVSAVSDRFVKSVYASYGEPVDVTAPGDTVLSAYRDAGYARASGTSFAAPLVSGAIALLLERYPGLSAEDIVLLLRDTAQPDADPSFHGLLGAGVVDASALTLAVTEDRTGTRAWNVPLGTIVSRPPVTGATKHHVVRGDVAALRQSGTTIDLGAVVCVARELPHAPHLIEAPPDDTRPAPGRAFFYLFGDDAAGPATPFGTGTSGAAREAGSGGCS